jgi:hypothetical protein
MKKIKSQPEVESVEARMYTTFCADFNLRPEWLGKTFTDHKDTYTITGLNPRSKKFPVTVSGGKYTSFKADYVIAYMTNTLDKLDKKNNDADAKKDAAMVKEARVAFPTMAKLFGLEPSWLDKVIDVRGEKYTIAGLNSDRSKFPVVLINSKGEVKGFTAEGVRMLLGDRAQVLKEREERCRDEYIHSFNHELNIGWLDKDFAFGTERLKIIGMERRGRTNHVIFEGGKCLAEVHFLAALKSDKNNEHLLSMPKVSVIEYCKKKLMAKRAATLGGNDGH